MSSSETSCVLCRPTGEDIIWQNKRCRIILVGDADYPSFCRVIWNKHAREMTDLTKSQRDHFLEAIYAVEQTLRDLLQPKKLNLASLGNQVPHLHWHVIPRFEDDAHFPDPIWASRQRAGKPHAIDKDQLVRQLYLRLGGRDKHRA